MALVNCPECGKENVSDTVNACPYCGFKIRKHYKKAIKNKTVNDLFKNPQFIKVTVSIISILIIVSGVFSIISYNRQSAFEKLQFGKKTRSEEEIIAFLNKAGLNYNEETCRTETLDNFLDYHVIYELADDGDETLFVMRIYADSDTKRDEVINAIDSYLKSITITNKEYEKYDIFQYSYKDMSLSTAKKEGFPYMQFQWRNLADEIDDTIIYTNDYFRSPYLIIFFNVIE